MNKGDAALRGRLREALRGFADLLLRKSRGKNYLLRRRSHTAARSKMVLSGACGVVKFNIAEDFKLVRRSQRRNLPKTCECLQLGKGLPLLSLSGTLEKRCILLRLPLLARP